MTTREFLLELRRLDVQLWLEGDKVRCSAPPDVLTPAHREELARRRVEIEALLKAARAAHPSSIVPIETAGQGAPFYAVPGHNGDVFCFVRLAKAMGADHRFYGLQPPGLDGSSPIETVEELAAHFVRELIAHQPDGPYHVGGYCLGGLTAFEMAQQLRAQGREVGLVVLFGTMSPPALKAPNRARAAIAEWAGARMRGARAFAALSGRERIHKIGAKAKAILHASGGAQDEDEFTQRRLRVEAATLDAAYSYRPHVFAGRLSLFVPNEAAAQSLDRPLEWSAYAADMDVFYGPATCDGDTMLKDPTAAVFAEQLARRLRSESAPRAVEVRA